MTASGLATRSSSAPLYAAGFVTAFGAHSIAAGLGAQSDNIGLTLLNLGILLALYDISEVFLKPVFGALSDRVGPKPVIVGGLFAFAALSLSGLWAADPLMLALARLGQGAAASAFSLSAMNSFPSLSGMLHTSNSRSRAASRSTSQSSPTCQPSVSQTAPKIADVASWMLSALARAFVTA